jgi:electron transfer flavoprotein beta subunit
MERRRNVRIVVVVKHVPDAGDPPAYAPDLTVDRALERGALNAADVCALEQAVRTARLRMDVRVTALTMGPPQASRSLLAALAQGADDAVHVCDRALHGSDALATSLVLAAAVRRAGFDLVLCGAASSDSGMAVIPAMLAERLGVPAIGAADAIRVDERSITGFCPSESGDEIDELACRLPALAAITDQAPAPRSPSFPALAEARGKLVRRWTLADLGVDSARVGLSGAACRVREVRDRRAPGPVVVEAVRDPGAAARAVADFLAERRLA